MNTKLKVLAMAIGVVAILSCTLSNSSTVYICTGKYATKYHYKQNCRGLSNCKGTIKAVGLNEAQKYRTLCGWED